MSIELNNTNLKNAQSGIIKDFEKLIFQYEKLYYSIAFRMINNSEDAQDITQDALLKIYKNLNSCIDIEHFKNWSCKIVTNTTIDYIRKRNRNITDSIDEKLEGTDGSFEKQIEDKKNLGPEEEVLKSEREELILKCIEELPEEQKVVIILRDLNDLAYDEISEIVELSLGTVKSRISRGRKNLKNILLNKMELFNNNNRLD